MDNSIYCDIKCEQFGVKRSMRPLNKKTLAE